MLHTSTKNIAYEVISCLIQVDNDKSRVSNNENGKVFKGVLTEIIKWLSMTNQHQMLSEVEFSILDQLSIKQHKTHSGHKYLRNNYGRRRIEDSESYANDTNLIISSAKKRIGGPLKL